MITILIIMSVACVLTLYGFEGEEYSFVGKISSIFVFAIIGAFVGCIIAGGLGFFSYSLPNEDVVDATYDIIPISENHPYIAYKCNSENYILFGTDSGIVNLSYRNFKISSDCERPKVVVSHKEITSRIFSKFMIEWNIADSKAVTVYLPIESEAKVEWLSCPQKQ